MNPAFGSNNSSVTVPATTVSSSAGILANNSPQIRVYNGSTGVAFWRAGKGSQTAVLTDAFVAPGATEVFSISPEADTVAAILNAGTGNVYFQRGGGV